VAKMMQANKWEAFLSDPELKSSKKYQDLQNGTYLFGKISHDTLACLNNYLAVLSLMSSQEVKVEKNTLARFTAKKEVVETAVIEIYSFLEQNERFPETGRDWPADIEKIGSKLSRVQNFVDEFWDMDESATCIERDLAKMAIANLRGLQAICKDIQAENYKQLLTIANNAKILHLRFQVL
jgi:hypothetical protein